MPKKMPTFSFEIKNSNNQPELLLANIKKYIDDQIEYNKFLANQAIIGNKTDILSIWLSIYFELPEAPKFKSISDEKFIPKKKLMVKKIIEVIKDYSEIKITADKASF